MNFKSILIKLIQLIILTQLIQFINCNSLFRRLCIPNIDQINELITRAFSIQDSSFNSTSKWTYEENLRSFCARNGFDDNKLPELIKISKLPNSQKDLPTNEQSDVVLTIKVPINQFLIDSKQETSFRFWFIHKWPFEPFLCGYCRTYLTFSTGNGPSENNEFSFIYGLMQNFYSSIVDTQLFETIKRENKEKFFEEKFIFMENQLDETNDSTTNSIDDLTTISPTTTKISPINKSIINSTTTKISPINNSTTKTTITKINPINNSTTKTTTTKISPINNSTTKTTTTKISPINNSTINSTINSTTNSIVNNQTTINSSSIVISTTNSIDNLTTITPIDNSTPIITPKLQIKTIYVNLSTFASIDKYLLVGMNMKETGNIIFNDTNGTKIRKKRNLGNDLNHIRSDKFYFEYNLCYSLINQLYLPNSNCLPLYLEDHLLFSDFNSNPIKVADCICWNFYAYKTILFYQLILFLVAIGLFLIFYNKLRRKRVLKQNKLNSRLEIKNTPNQLINPDSKLVVYQIILQIHNPTNNKCELPGLLKVKLYSNQDQLPFYELQFNQTNQFFRPFLFTDDILQTSTFLYSDIKLRNIKRLVVEYESLDNKFMNIYLYGLIITNGLDFKFIFPYSNYLIHRTEVNLSENNIWLTYMSRSDNLYPISEMLPITNPIYLRLSRIEKIIFLISFTSKLALSPLKPEEVTGSYFKIFQLFNLIYHLLMYTIFFIIFMFYLKPVLIREYFLIKLTQEFFELKIISFAIFFFLLQQLFATTTSMSNNIWKDNLTLDNVRNYESILLENDLNWVIEFLMAFFIFLIYLYFFEHYFYKSKKQQNIPPGPSNSLEDRLINNNN